MITQTFEHITKPWGGEAILALTEKYCLKQLHINAGHRTSLQYHDEKMESIYIVSGTGELTFSDEDGVLRSAQFGPGCGWTVKPKQIHQMKATTDVVYYEASTTELQDVVRVADDYGRKDV